MSSPSLYDQEGRPVRLGPELGKGGEGAVFAVAGASELAAKVYHQPIDARKAEKLAAMVRQRNEGLLAVAAWPVGLLSLAPRAAAVGLLMPRVSGFKPIHLLYGPKSRLAEFPEATWAFLVHAAGNVARALAVLHEAGNVVGDINHGNILVSSRGTVKLIDCDSFQIQSGAQRFLCEVGVPTHTPPELQGRNLRTVTRTPNHDAFGLAVVIFQLLFLGRHPFSGTYLGRGDMPLEQAIREIRFAYGREAAVHRMRQPPHTPPLAVASPPVAALFERAFSPGSARDGVRPLPREWVEVLDALPLRTCERRSLHAYAATLDSCPWCPIEVTTGTSLFKAPGPPRVTASNAFDVAAAWEKILAVHPLGASPPIPSGALPSSLYVQMMGLAWKRALLYLFCFAVSIVVALVEHNPRPLLLCSAVLGISGGLILVTAKAGRRAQDTLDELKTAWNHPIDASFQSLLRNLDHAVQSYLELPALHRRRLGELEAGLRRRQLERFLDLHRLDGSGLEGLTPAWLATLQSHGIETAADAMARNLLKVPGLDPALMDRLRRWRGDLEDGFLFDPAAAGAVDPDDLMALSEAIHKARRILEAELLAGPGQLRKCAEGLLHRRQTLIVQIENAQRARDRAVESLRKLLSRR
jgi:DNA-binding helix-hairpin-helix protein with protein kinase domain